MFDMDTACTIWKVLYGKTKTKWKLIEYRKLKYEFIARFKRLVITQLYFVLIICLFRLAGWCLYWIPFFLYFLVYSLQFYTGQKTSFGKLESWSLKIWNMEKWYSLFLAINSTFFAVSSSYRGNYFHFQNYFSTNSASSYYWKDLTRRNDLHL